MTQSVRCPDCGFENPPGSESCARCNHPLHEVDHEPAAPAPAPPAAAPPPHEPAPVVIRRRPIRPRPPRSRDAQVVQQLWLVFGVIAVLAVLWVAIQSNVQRLTPPVAGSSADQQKRADALAQQLARDSTDVLAHHELANILYDTGNWSDAIVHYRAAIRRDSSLVTAIVDLGVCYYSLSDVDEAERLFTLALAKDPHQTVALFNLGIVNEGRGELRTALGFYHRAMQSGPPESMKKPLADRMSAIMQKLGASAPALPDGKP